MNIIADANSAARRRRSDDYLLGRALDREYMLNEFRRLRSDNWRDTDVVNVQSAKLIRQKQARRSLIKYDIDVQRPSGIRRVSLLGKIRNQGFDWRTFELATELWNTTFGNECSDGVYVPEPIAAMPKLNMWLQEFVNARSLTMSLESPTGLKNCADAGYALGKLHARGPATDRRRDLSDELNTLSRVLLAASDAAPRYAGRIRKVLSCCYELAGLIPVGELTGIHRDFYPDQVLSGPHSTWLVDLDMYALGDPALDLGNFIGHLQELGLRQFGDCRHYSAHEQAFLSAYTESTGRFDCQFVVAAYSTLTLARHIAISRRIPARKNSTGKLLSLCEERLSVHGMQTHTYSGTRCASYLTSVVE